MVVDKADEAIVRERRLRAARALVALAVEDVPEPEELTRQLDGVHGPNGLR